MVKTKKETYFTASEATEWLNERMQELEISSLEALSQLADIDKGTLSRYFRHERRPSIDYIGPLCQALQISPERLLKVLGAIPK